MRYGLIGASLAACVAFSADCAANDEHGKDFEIFAETTTLDELEIDFDSILPNVKGSFDRDRVGARFAWGNQSVRGFFQVFADDWSVANSSETLYKGIGVGGGAMGTPVLGDDSNAVQMILPWRVDMSLAYADGESAGFQDDIYIYSEFHGDVGFGVDWKGLRPTVGIAATSHYGYIASDSILSDDKEITGLNIGTFFDVKYKHPNYIAYGHLRLQGGDYEQSIIGIGFKF